MPATTLIAYATRNGSTQEVAESISKTLRDAGVSTELVRMQKAAELDGYSVAILGVPLYMGRLLKEFHEFVEHFREQLLQMEVWCFVLGPVENKPEQFIEAERQALTQFIQHSWLVPREVKIFGGLWDVKRMEFPFRILRWLPAGKLPTMDARDWDAIEQWTTNLAKQIAKPNKEMAI